MVDNCANSLHFLLYVGVMFLFAFAFIHLINAGDFRFSWLNLAAKAGKVIFEPKPGVSDCSRTWIPNIFFQLGETLTATLIRPAKPFP